MVNWKRKYIVAILSAIAMGGVASSARAGGDGPIKIGVPFPETGPLGILYQPEKQAVELAVSDVNAKGGILGRKVEVRYADTEGKPDVARKELEKLALEGYNLIFGTMTSGSGLAVAPHLKQWNAVLVSPLSKSPKLIGDSCQSRFFRTDPSDPMETAVVKTWLETRKEKKWATIGIDYAFGHEVTAGFTALAKSLGKEVVSSTYSPMGTNDFAPYIQQIKASGADGVFVIIPGQDAVNFVKQAKQFGLLGAVTMGGVTYNGDASLQVAGNDMIGVWGNIEFSSTMDTPEAKAFVADWKKMYDGALPTDQAGQTYLGITVLLQGIEKAGSDDPAAVAKALSGGTFDTLFGKVVMRAEDHQLMIPTYFGQVQMVDGQPHNVVTLTVPAEKTLPNPDPACKMTMD
jgi:branched-chain amino acid transport system substrate-binding protein